MLRKIALASLAVVAGLFILNSTHLGSYARTAWKKCRDAAKAQVSLEYQLEALRNEVNDFMPEMRKQISALAGETMSVKNLRSEVNQLKVELGKQGSSIQARKDELKSGIVKTSFEVRPATLDRLRRGLDRDLASYKRCSDELKAKESLLEAKEQGLAAEQEKLASMRSQKEQWEAQIAELETQVKLLRTAQAKSSFHLDDSKFSQIKATLADIKNQIEFQRTENDMWGAFSGDVVAVEKKSKTDAQLIREVEETFGDNSDIREAQK